MHPKNEKLFLYKTDLTIINSCKVYFHDYKSTNHRIFRSSNRKLTSARHKNAGASILNSERLERWNTVAYNGEKNQSFTTVASSQPGSGGI